MYNPLKFLGAEIKASERDLSGLNEVRILNAKGELIRTVYAKRLEDDVSQFSQTKRANKRKNRERQKKLKASDLIEI